MFRERPSCVAFPFDPPSSVISNTAIIAPGKNRTSEILGCFFHQTLSLGSVLVYLFTDHGLSVHTSDVLDSCDCGKFREALWISWLVKIWFISSIFTNSMVSKMRCIPRSLHSHLAKIRWVQSEPEYQRRHSSYGDLLLNCQKLPNRPTLIYATEQMNSALPKLYPADRSHCLDLWN